MSIPRRSVTILGASGFLGGNMARFLANRGHSVRACMRDRDAADRLSNDRIECVLGNNHEHGFLREVLQGTDIVFEFSAATKPMTNFSNPGLEFNSTVLPLIDIVEQAIHCGVSKVVYPSSAGVVYGQCDQPCDESAPLSPQTPYAFCKIACESRLGEYVAQNKIAADIYRIGNPFGPGQFAVRGSGVIAHWSRAVLDGGRPVVIGDNDSRRDYIYIDDVCRALEKSLENPGESVTMNVGAERSISILELFELFQEAYGEKIDAEFQPRRITDNTLVQLDCGLMKSSVPDLKLTDVLEGIRNTIEWHRENLTPKKRVGS